MDSSFLTPKFICGRPPFPLKFALKVTHPPFKQHNFDQYLLIAPQPCELANKVQLALIGSRPCAFQRAIDESCTLPLSPPKGGTKRDFAIFSSKFQLLPKNVCYKVSLCENFQQHVVATSFFYLKVHRWIAGDFPIYQKFAIKVTHPFTKCRFRQILLNSAAAMIASDNNSISTNRKLTVRFPASHR